LRYVDGITKKLEPAEIWVNLPIAQIDQNYIYVDVITKI